MKKLLLLSFIFLIAFGQTRTPVMQFVQYSAGDTLKAGDKNNRSVSNSGLNNMGARLEHVLTSAGLDTNGRSAYLYGKAGQTTLTVDVDYGTSVGQLIVNDSLSVNYNIEGKGNLRLDGRLDVSGNASVNGNFNVGGYLVGDSIQLTSGVLFMSNGDITGLDDITQNTTSGVLTNSYTNSDDSISIGRAGDNDGRLTLVEGDGGQRVSIIVGSGNSITANRTLTVPDVTGTLATTNGAQNFTSVKTVLATDSITAPTVYQTLFSSPVVAGVSLNDSAGAYQEWTTNSSTARSIVRLRYLHKAGIKNIVARVQAKNPSDAYNILLQVGNLTTTTSGGEASYTAKTLTLAVGGLTSGTLYDLKFTLNATGGTSSVTQLVITAESI